MSDTFQYREEIDLQKMVDEQARELQRRVDEATLDKAADTLADFGYVKADGKNRWLELFGTPGRAARTLQGMCDETANCDLCEIQRVIGFCGNYETLLEWLEGEDE